MCLITDTGQTIMDVLDENMDDLLHLNWVSIASEIKDLLLNNLQIESIWISNINTASTDYKGLCILHENGEWMHNMVPFQSLRLIILFTSFISLQVWLSSHYTLIILFTLFISLQMWLSSHYILIILFTSFISLQKYIYIYLFIYFLYLFVYLSIYLYYIYTWCNNANRNTLVL